jgi:hypothetical protein
MPEDREGPHAGAAAEIQDAQRARRQRRHFPKEVLHLGVIDGKEIHEICATQGPVCEIVPAKRVPPSGEQRREPPDAVESFAIRTPGAFLERRQQFRGERVSEHRVLRLTNPTTVV